MRPKRMAHKGFTIFSLNIFYPVWCLPCSRSITCKIHLLWFLSCFLALILIFFLWLKTKIVFVLVFHFVILANLSKIYHLWFRKWCFWFSKWDRYGSYPRDCFSSGYKSATLKAKTLRNISWPNKTERVFFLRKLPQQPSEQLHRLLS